LSHLLTWKYGTEPEFQYGMKSKNQKNPDGPNENGVFGINGYSKHYDLMFNPQNVKTLYKMWPAEEAGSITLVIQKDRIRW
jgi:hypothetical protein